MDQHTEQGVQRRSVRLVRSSHQRAESVVKIALSFVAVLLIVGGFATPQIVQAIEFQSRDSFVADLVSQQESLSDKKELNDAKSVLIGLQLREIEHLTTEIDAVLTKHGETIEPSAVAPLVHALDSFTEVQLELSEYRTNTLVINAVEKIQNRGQIDSTNPDTEIQLMRAFSWFTVEPEAVREKFDIRPIDFEPLPIDLSKMTNFQFSEVKEQLAEAERDLLSENSRAATLADDQKLLQSAAESLLGSLKAVVTGTLEIMDPLEERAVVFGYDLELLHSLKEEVRTVLASTKYDYSSSGGLALHPHPQSSVIGTTDNIGPGVHGLLIMRSLNDFLTAVVDADRELLAYEEEAAAIEAERLYQLELEQQRLYEEQLQREREEEITPPSEDDEGPVRPDVNEQPDDPGEQPSEPSEEPAPNPVENS